jgi:N-dimethylarginine dimethylaminohydrolase
MVAPLKRVLLCPPAAAGWSLIPRRNRWRELGFLHEPVIEAAETEHARLRQALESAGCEILTIGEAEDLTLDAIYAHDASLLTDQGAICLRMGKSSREAEATRQRAFYEFAGIPVAGVMDITGSAEAGDIVWLDPATLLVGRGFRTNAGGIEWLRGLLTPHGVDVLSAPLPYGSGPGTCLHLMSLMSMLDENTILVDLPLLSVETVELLRARGFRLADIDASERATLAANVLSLGNVRLLALEQNPLTNTRLRKLGFEVMTFPGAEIGINGGGGPTCLTRPVLRMAK